MKTWKYTFIILLLVLSMVVIAIFQIPDGNLHIIACNVGQGDAILVTYGSTQILTDGGPDKSVLSCLGKYIPFWDRNIELVVSTHPDADHSTGLVEVIKDYKVGQILINDLDPGTDVYRALENVIATKGVAVINPVEGMGLRVGLIQLDVLHPSDEFKSQNSKIKSGVTNLFSIVYLLNYGQFKALMLGDIPPEVSDSLASGQTIDTVNYIKIPHHGSLNGLTENLLKAIMPTNLPAGRQVAVISVGKNSWGFPRPEILDMLARYNVKVYRTDQMGDVEVITDGKGLWIRNVVK